MTEIGDRLIKLMKDNLHANLPDLNMSYTIDTTPASGYHAQAWYVAVWDPTTLVQIRKCKMYVDNAVVWIEVSGTMIARHYFDAKDRAVYSKSTTDTPVQVINIGIDYLIGRGDYARS